MDLVGSSIGAFIIGILLLMLEYRTRWFAQFIQSSISSSNEVFIIYSEQVEQDGKLKSYLEETFNKYHIRVFPELKIGDDPGIIYPEQLQKCKYVLVLLSEQSLQDEFFVDLVIFACSIKPKLFHTESSKILPIRANYRKDFPDFIPYIKQVKSFEWQNLKDNRKLASELLRIITGKNIIIIDSAMPSNYIPGGQFLEGKFSSASSAPSPDINIGEGQSVYIKRDKDDEFVKALLIPGSIITIRGAHQMGMTSLLKYGVDLINEPRHIVWINFKPLTYDPKLELNTLLYNFAQKITVQLKLDQNDLDTSWPSYSTPIRKLDSYMTKFVLQYALETETPIILILDDVGDWVRQMG